VINQRQLQYIDVKRLRSWDKNYQLMRQNLMAFRSREYKLVLTFTTTPILEKKERYYMGSVG